MSVTILRLGTPRKPGEGLRLGMVRRPPRGVPKADFAKRDFYDVWLPTLAPSEPLLKEAMATHDPHAEHSERAWKAFERRYRAEMKRPEAAHLLDLLASLSHQTDFSLGCYCVDESRCHRSILGRLLAERGAAISWSEPRGWRADPRASNIMDICRGSAMRRWFACFFLFFLCAAGFAATLHAQDQDDPLTDDEVQAVRDNKTNPNERIKLYIKFIDQRLDAIRQLTGPGKSEKEKADIHDKLEEFTHLCDELQDNLDTYDEAHADIRKSLKDLVADSAKWPVEIRAVGDDPSFDFSQKTALEAAKSAAEEAHQLSLEQDVYFDAHKKERGGTGTGPR